VGNKEKRRARSKAVKKLAKIQRRLGAPGPSAAPPFDGPKFGWTYPTAIELAAGGPLVMAEWSLPRSLSAALAKLGRPIPSPVVGFMLVDTGATKTNIAEEVAQQLGLKPVGQSEGYGATGKHVRNDYQAHLSIRIRDALGKETLIESEQQASGVPDLAKHSAALGIKTQGGPVVFIGLLGRDFLQHTTFTYRGTKGSFEIRVHVDSMAKPPPVPTTIHVPSAGEAITNHGGSGAEAAAPGPANKATALPPSASESASSPEKP